MPGASGIYKCHTSQLDYTNHLSLTITDIDTISSSSDSDSSSLQEKKWYEHCRRLKLTAAFAVIYIVATAAIIYTDPFFNIIHQPSQVWTGCVNFSMSTYQQSWEPCIFQG